MTCVYGCQKDGTPCPRPHTCHTIGMQRAIDEQARTDRQDAQCCTGNCRQGRDCTRASYGIGGIIKMWTIVVGVVALVALFADWLAHQLIRG